MTGPTDTVTDALTLGALGHAESLARWEPYAVAVGAAINAEAAMALPRIASDALMRQFTGVTTEAQRRVDRERRAREALVSNGDRTRRRAAAFWHEGGSGPPLLLINGWTASGLMWPSAFVERLEARFHVVRIDNRGSGYSRCAPMPWSIGTMADDAAAALRATTSEPAVVVGLSMGGMIAQELALRHPDLVRGLVLAGTRPPAPAHIQVSGDVVAAVMRPPSPGESLRDYYAAAWAEQCASGFAAAHPELVDELVEQIIGRPTPKASVYRQMSAIAAWHGPRRLAAISCPVTVVHGDVDPLMPVGNGMRLARLIPGARYVELAGVGHIVPLEAMAPLAEVIEGFGRTN
jgi:pimeloyl-ACP methyl ester carboxylesterase